MPIAPMNPNPGIFATLTPEGDLVNPVNWFPSMADISNGIPILLNPTYETLKIEIAVVILIAAFAVMLHAAYKWYLHRYHVWVMEQELSAMVEAGMHVDPDDYKIPEMEGAKTFALIGGLVIAAGIVLYIF